MKPVDFALHRPATLDEALTLLDEYGDDAKALAGGQSLVPLLNFRLARPGHVVDLARIGALSRIQPASGEVRVGAMVRQAAAERSADVLRNCPLLAAALPNIAHPPIRNRGTVGGSLAHADPAAELPAVAAALDAVFIAASTSGRREIPAAEFFDSYFVTALRPDELLTEIRFPAAGAGTGAAFREVARRRGDFALAGAAVQLTVSGGTVVDARVCFSSVAGRPYRHRQAEEMLTGRTPDESLPEAEAVVRDTLTPPADLHATAGYRRHIAGVLLRRAVADAWAQATRPAG